MACLTKIMFLVQNMICNIIKSLKFWLKLKDNIKILSIFVHVSCVTSKQWYTTKFEIFLWFLFYSIALLRHLSEVDDNLMKRFTSGLITMAVVAQFVIRSPLEASIRALSFRLELLTNVDFCLRKPAINWEPIFA